MSKLLGDVSAYAYAVSQGYTGTEEQFAADMARIATTASEAAASADAAAESASEAQASAEQAEQSAQSIEGDVERAEQAATTATGKATEAATSATTANGAAQTATGKAAQAEQSATAAANSASAAATSASNAASSATAAQTAQTAAETAQGKAEDAQAAAEAAAASIDPDTLVKKTELEDYAKIDGSYETMTVGNAEQLVATVGVDDNSPYNFRHSGGSADIGDREMVNAVVGVSLPWNQKLIDISNFANNTDTAKWRPYDVSNGSLSFASDELTYTVTTVGNTVWDNGIKCSDFYKTQGHVLLLAYKIYVPKPCKVTKSYYQGYVLADAVAGWNDIATIQKTLTSGNSTNIFGVSYLTDAGYVVGDTYKIKYPMIIDLTLLFGSTIADYIYSLEQANEGAGVAYFRKLFPKPFYEFNSGELLSVNTSQHKMVGFNAFNPETGTARLVGGMQYQITGAYTALTFDGETVTPDASGYFTPSANGVLTVTGGDSSTTCVHLVWSGYRNGEYEPYKEWVYPLDSSLTLRGILKLDASGNLYYDGDTYAADGTVTRKYGIVDLGTLTWGCRQSSGRSIFEAAINGIKQLTSGSEIPNLVCVKYRAVAYNSSWVDGDMSAGALNSNRVYFVNNAYTDVASFKAAMNGVYLVYELATPTTETATSYTQIQSVDDFGTEEYTDYAYENGDRDVAIPVGSNTFYPANLRDKLQHLPDLASADGYYMIQQINNEMSLVLFRIPQASGLADGTYTLKATVASGTPTYTWVSDTAESEG